MLGRLVLKPRLKHLYFTLNLNTTDSTIADVEGVLYETYGDAVAVTAITWSTSTLTFKDNAQFEGAFVVTLV